MNGAVCFSRGDAPVARKLAAYLGAHTSLRCELSEAGHAGELLDVVEQCLSYEFVIVMLSHSAVPSLWPRAEWERVLVDEARSANATMAYILLEPCPFPPVLRRHNFFDLTGDGGEDFRAIRRWVIGRLWPERMPPPVDTEGVADESLPGLVEAPGFRSDVSIEAADWMLRTYWRDFERVHTIRCAHLQPAGVLGELAQELGLRLPGMVAQNVDALREWSREHRALYVFEDIEDDAANFIDLGGKASVLVVRATKAATGVSWAEVKQVFSERPVRDERGCLRAMAGFIRGAAEEGPWTEVYSVAMQALRIFLKNARLAEGQQLLVWLARLARKHGDGRALKHIEWEESWILEEWDLSPQERALVPTAGAMQLWLPL